MKHAIEAMLETGGGVVVDTSSTAGRIGQENISPYTFTKAGIVGLTRAAAVEYAGRGIRVNAVAPTVVMTPLVRRFIEAAPDPAEMHALDHRRHDPDRRRVHRPLRRAFPLGGKRNRSGRGARGFVTGQNSMSAVDGVQSA
jgi:NAD(P)-dependent dehydrogenase (short-subunit alcohol dehydrogenase family)